MVIEVGYLKLGVIALDNRLLELLVDISFLELLKKSFAKIYDCNNGANILLVLISSWSQYIYQPIVNTLSLSFNIIHTVVTYSSIDNWLSIFSLVI